MDAASCEVLETSKTVCKEYATCNEQATASYNLDVASVQTQESGLKHEWTAILQMNCQLSVFTTVAKDKKSSLMACINKDYTTEVNAAVTLQYPSPVPRAPKTCETASGTAGAAAYEESNYKTLPSNAPAKACVAECCAQEVLETAAPKKLTNPLLANLAGEWSVHYARWGSRTRFHPIKISCSGSYTVWNRRSSKIVLSGADFKKKCKKRTGTPQFLVPKWAGQNKFECGWYIADKDTFRMDHYTSGYWGTLTQAKRVKKYDCPWWLTEVRQRFEKQNICQMLSRSMMLIVRHILWEQFFERLQAAQLMFDHVIWFSVPGGAAKAIPESLRITRSSIVPGLPACRRRVA